jgi:hypothetical protein
MKIAPKRRAPHLPTDSGHPISEPIFYWVEIAWSCLGEVFVIGCHCRPIRILQAVALHIIVETCAATEINGIARQTYFKRKQKAMRQRPLELRFCTAPIIQTGFRKER